MITGYFFISMYLLYSLLLTIGLIALLPKFLLDALRHGKYLAGVTERLGTVPSLDTSSKVIWIHAVSVGETQAARPLIQALLKNYPTHKLVISTTTLTGQRLAQDIFGQQASRIFYFPFDWIWSIRRTMKRIKPNVVLIMETELWPNFLRECRRRDIPVALVNGRISEKSFNGYNRFRWFINSVVNNLSLAIMQTKDDAERILKLGLDPARLIVSGNIKFDMEAATDEESLSKYFEERFNFNNDQPLIIAASTHAPEEEVILDSFKRLRVLSNSTLPRLLLAPRHPERFSEVASLLEHSGLTWVRRSGSPKEEDRLCDVVLLDSIGEIRSIYALAQLVFVGGSITKRGGHNILEPAISGRCIITGAHTFNFSAIVDTFLKSNALIQLSEVEEEKAAGLLYKEFHELLINDTKRNKIGLRAKKVLEDNRGATNITINSIDRLIKKESSFYSTSNSLSLQHPV
jgi:3-deoxy-D-manno-octulosonic-acid transferase